VKKINYSGSFRKQPCLKLNEVLVIFKLRMLTRGKFRAWMDKFTEELDEVRWDTPEDRVIQELHLWNMIMSLTL